MNHRLHLRARESGLAVPSYLTTTPRRQSLDTRVPRCEQALRNRWVPFQGRGLIFCRKSPLFPFPYESLGHAKRSAAFSGANRATHVFVPAAFCSRSTTVNNKRVPPQRLPIKQRSLNGCS